MSNQAAYILRQGFPLQVDIATFPRPGRGQIVIKNAAWGVNPVDWKTWESGAFLNKYPFILGWDIAGEVVDVGPGLARFERGDRVTALAIAKVKDDPIYGGFQKYTLAEDILAAKIPDSLKYQDAAVLPLAMSTAAVGLYDPDALALPLPISVRAPLSANKTLLVWGGASSVGLAVVQLAYAVGLDVVATASPQNFPLLRELGATEVLDYHSDSLVDDTNAAITKIGKPFVGVFDAVGLGGWEELLSKFGGRIASTLGLPETLPLHTKVKGIFAGTLAMQNHEIARSLWVDFLPKALETGIIKAKPDPLIFPGGLRQMQQAMERQKQGVSARKVVVIP